MKIVYKNIISIMLIGIILFSMTGCSSNEEVQALKRNMLPIQSVKSEAKFEDLLPMKNILQDKKIIGMGEATHGNKEFLQMKQHIFEFLVKELGVKVFTMEGDFGGGQAINDYILNNAGNAKDAAISLDMAVYKTTELVDIVEWMHDYNSKVEDKDKLHFYGFDMQRYDKNKEGLVKYLKKVDSGVVPDYEKGLADLNDDKVFDQDKAKIKAGLDKIKEIIAKLNENKEKYISASSQKEYELALKYADIIMQNASIRYATKNYGTDRDAFMASNISWILDYEKNFGNDKIFASAHDGHIEKSSSSAYHSMGNVLADKYGTQYYALGTEFYQSTFSSKDESDNKRKIFNIKASSSSYLANKLMKTGIGIGWIDFNKASSDKIISDILQKPQKLNNIGDSFSRWMYISDRFYTLEQIPAKAYDGLIFISKVTPTTPLSGENYEVVNGFLGIIITIVVVLVIIIAVIAVCIRKHKKRLKCLQNNLKK